MNTTLRRSATLLGATLGALALSTTSAMAHYCYRTDVPAGSKMANGNAWHTKAEALAVFPEFLPDGACEDRIIAHITAMPDNTLFMGPGLLAGGAIPQGKGPAGVGHLFEDAMGFPECAFLFE